METNTLRGLLIHLGIISSLLCLLSFTFFYAVLPALTNKDKIVTVPNLKGMTISEASKFLKNHDLNIGVIDSFYSLKTAPLTILKQYPKPFSKVKVNRKIDLTLNTKMPPMVKYPDLTGSGFDLAQKQLQILNLQIGEIQYQPDIARNSILESKVNGRVITPGENIPQGSRVDLVVGI